MKLLLMILFLFATQLKGELQNQIKKYLNEQFAGYEKYNYEIVYAPDNYEYLEMVKSEIKVTGGMIYIPVVIMKDNNKTRSYISLKISLFKNVVVAKENIKRNEHFNLTNVEVKLADVTKTTGRLIESVEELNQTRSKINFPKDAIITKEYIEPFPVINIGDKITALVINGNAEVSIAAFARQEGAVEDIIRIISVDKKNYKAKVIDSKNAIIIE